MQFFKDTKDRRWEITVTIPLLKRVKALLNIDLMQLFEDNCKLLSSFSDDFALQVDVLYVLCEEQCKVASVTDVEFGSSLGGDSLESAWFAMLDSVIDFFPNASRRETARKIVEKAKELSQSMSESALKQLNALPSSWPELQALTPRATVGAS
jgi:hypothetical protein